jgi:uncharacterized protein
MSTHPSEDLVPAPPPETRRGLAWVFVGPHGLRAGWSVLLAYWLFELFRQVISLIFLSAGLVSEHLDFSSSSVLKLEAIPFLAMLATGWFIAFIERRHLLDFNLKGPWRLSRFLTGLGAGMAALSALIGALAWGGWLHFGAPSLAGTQILRMAALWGCAFLLLGCVEEGLFRGYLLFTLTRGLNLAWAVAAESGLCLYLALHKENSGSWGVYAFALLGLTACLALARKQGSQGAFWQAAWITSTGFGMIHTFNRGENAMGVFAAAGMGFVFCLSVRVTGSAWWAIGFHTAWDWAETYFYGTSDSGLAARGHFLSTRPAGNPMLSGGADGPEGSLLVLGILALLLAALPAVYARRRSAGVGSYSGPER